MGDLVPAILGLIAAIAVPAVIHRATHPKRRVSYFLQITPEPRVPVASQTTQPGDSSPPAGWPMLVTVKMWSSGRADVPSASFDGGLPLVVQFSTPLLKRPGVVDEPSYLGGFEQEGANRLRFSPALIGGGRVFTASVVVSNPVHFMVRHPLVDVEVTESRTPPQAGKTTRGVRRLANNGMFWGILQIVVGFVLTIVSSATYDSESGWGVAFVLVAGLLLDTGVVTLIVTAIVRLVRWLTSRKRQRRVRSGTSSGDVSYDIYRA